MRTTFAIASLAALAGCATPDTGPMPGMTPVTLTSVPGARQMASFYPADAMRRRLAGRAVMTCKVPVSGLLTDCRIVSETAPSFGIATLKIARFFLARPATRDGQPVESSITLPIVWKIAD